MSDAYICDAVRTPFGRYAGSLSAVRTDDLAAVPLKALVERNSAIDWEAVDDVVRMKLLVETTREQESAQHFYPLFSRKRDTCALLRNNRLQSLAQVVGHDLAEQRVGEMIELAAEAMAQCIRLQSAGRRRRSLESLRHQAPGWAAGESEPWQAASSSSSARSLPR